jgi:tRNA dimethylallyltransferase
LVTKLLSIVGPTAAGKTRMGIEVAVSLGARDHDVEIISCDSMAVYRGLDVVADKPSADERHGIPHHLLDVADPDEDFTAVSYRELARTAIDSIGARSHVPMLVGGSGLYFRAVVDELEFAPTEPDVRARLDAADPAELYARLRKADPASAERIDPRNVRRVVRAVEVLELTGRPPSELRGSWERFESPYELAVVGLTWDREVLLKRAEERVHRELEAGLVEEVRGVAVFSRTARQALGVKEIVPLIEEKVTLQEATKQLVGNTKNFVRRQLSWFGADPRIVWVNASELSWEGARERIVELFTEAL